LSEETKDKELQRILSESPEGVAELLKSAAHPIRMQVLTMLLSGKHEFSGLMRKTRLSKTALANHLNRLVKKGLVQRVSRGEYILTVDGEELLNAAARVYRDSAQREDERRRRLLRLYTKGVSEERKMSKKIITKTAEYQPCWLSYTGAVAGCLTALGVKRDIVDVGGQSGYAFIINVAKGVTCPSGPTALHPKTWSHIHKGTEDLGWTIEHYWKPPNYPAKEGSITAEERERAKKLFEMVRHEIDKSDRPMILWGLPIPEYGIVNGYEGNAYITSTYRSLANQGKPEEPVPYDALKAPGGLEAIFFRNKAEANVEAADKLALERATKFADAEVPIHARYVAGPAALDEWADVLEHAPEDKQIYHGNSYVGACVCEGRAICKEFLERLAERDAGEQAKHLLEASRCYERGAALMKEFTKIFPFKFEGEMKPEDRKIAAETLRKVKPCEEEAVKHMKRALEEWQK
jgi:DNA-binding HxlR family transcriptional regulator